MRHKFDDIAINSTIKKKPTETDKDTYLGLEHLDKGNLTVTRFGAEVAPIGEKLIMRKGDVLFGKRRAYQKKVAIAPFDGIFSAHGMVLRPKTDVVTERFFPLFISSDLFLDAAIKISVGSLSPTINWRDLKELEFELPSLDEQRRLNDVFWAMIEAKNAYKLLISLTEDIVKSQFIEMFGVGTYPRIQLRELCTVITKGTTPTTLGYDFVNDGINFIKIENITEDGRVVQDKVMQISDVCNEKLRRSQLKNGDILFSIAGAIGRCAVVTEEILPANTNQALAIIRLKDDVIVNREFLFATLRSDEVVAQYEDQKQGIAQLNLSLQNVGDFIIPMPPLELQKRFLAFIRQVDKSKFMWIFNIVLLSNL